MKISKIPGLGRFGIFIDDLDFVNLTDEEWLEIGQLHLDSLVTIIRNVNLTPIEYEIWMRKWGTPRNLSLYRVLKKYKITRVDQIYGKDEVNGIPVSIEDKNWVKTLLNLVAVAETKGAPETQILRVSGKKNEHGDPVGMFAEGELRWHSNESGNLLFAPAVSLLGHHGVVGSATGFLTTPDWYEEQTESFRSELDEMIIEHRFTPGRINPGLRVDQDDIMYRNMCPAPIDLPLVIKSPIGIKGLHYSVNTISTIKGMSEAESKSVFDQIDKTLFVEKYIYDHWYKQDNDLCLFDNSITLHRRLGGIADRLCYRLQYDYGKIAKSNQPYLQDPYASEYNTIRDDVNNVLNIHND
jgi:alpha-ketoglutarate-dependent taurine dioxygenase